MEKKMAESKYPMDYEEYERKVIEIFLKHFEDDEELDAVKAKLDKFLEAEKEFIEGLYGADCFTYDNPKLYGDNCKKVFEDYHIETTPVAQLRMLLEGE